MSTEAIILVMLGIIGTLATALVSTWIKQIKDNIKELKDMFVRHVRNRNIHVNYQPEEE